MKAQKKTKIVKKKMSSTHYMAIPTELTLITTQRKTIWKCLRKIKDHTKINIQKEIHIDGQKDIQEYNEQLKKEMLCYKMHLISSKA